RFLYRAQVRQDLLELLIAQDAVPVRHSFRYATVGDRGHERGVHLVAITVPQQAQVDPALALDRVGAVTVRAVLVEQLAARHGLLGTAGARRRDCCWGL